VYCHKEPDRSHKVQTALSESQPRYDTVSFPIQERIALALVSVLDLIKHICSISRKINITLLQEGVTGRGGVASRNYVAAACVTHIVHTVRLRLSSESTPQGQRTLYLLYVIEYASGMFLRS
jgi:hypothetical protein